MAAAIEFSGVHLVVPGDENKGRALLDDVSLQLEAGTVTALLGRSGSGKTTLLRMVNRLAVPTSGTVRVHGEDVAQKSVVELRRGIGYVIQDTGLFPHLTIARNITMVPELSGHPRQHFAEQVRQLLTAVGLDPARFAKRHPHQLSGGQRQRVGLARALAAEPPILLMDEPFGALDPLTRAEMQDMVRGLLQRLRDRGQPKTVLLVTHDLDEAMYLADRIVLVCDGRIEADLAPAEFLHSQQHAVAEYVCAFHRGERKVTA
ncbi:ATP-binding cassette domain-containing protein [Acidipila sp. EB88]|uniref:ATP-binding cassette domain-containing protein n=1 Tax=Acidipila sp. EB88 TaxID=2305226 RepID=UPI000F5DB628|nr:ATP-binding cassette domain-containing protein [Acidipila sp. EB88]RRA49688.1 ATP-binding cassette domain-containing protein [Acidipila sp. EB88]